jgi:competence protein ComEC
VQRAPLVLAALAFAAGLVPGLTRPAPDVVVSLLVPLALFGSAAALLLAMRTGPGSRVLLALMAAAGLLLGMGARTEFERSCLHWLPEDRATGIVGTVVAGSGAQVRLELEAVRIYGQVRACSVEVPARIGRGGGRAAEGVLTELVTGTTLEAQARWWSPPGSGMTALRRPGALMLEQVTRVQPGATRPGLGVRIRGSVRGRVESLFGDQAPLAASVILAQRDALDPEVRDRFARAGLSHLLAISGLHVGLVCGLLLLAGGLLRIGKQRAAILGAAGTVGYVLLLGAPHSAVRAALQLVLLLAATMLQRPTRPEALLAAAGMIILALEPGALLSPGFQLSFAGVAGLLALRPPILRGLRARAGSGWPGRAWRWLADALATSIAATLATAPVVAWHFGQVAPVGILANLVAIPLLSLALPALAVALLTSGVSSAAGAFLAGPGVVALAALERSATAAAAVPWGSVAVQGSTAMILAAALVVGYWITRRLGQVRVGVRAAAWVGVTLTLVLATGARPPSDWIEIHVIDVGQGDAVAVRSPAGRWLLVDAGMAGRGFDAGERRVVPYLTQHGVRRLEGVVLTHPHLDHMGGAAAVVRRLRPRWVADPGSVASSPAYLDLLREAERTGSPWMGVRQGHRFGLDGMTVEFLHPAEVGATEADPNDLSVVMKISYGDLLGSADRGRHGRGGGAVC